MSFENVKQQALVGAGPTASGKSSLAIDIALALAERTGQKSRIINADSQQLYKGLPILSAQPGPEDLAQVPHRLYAVLDGATACDAHAWREMAKVEITAAHDAQELPILVGGTGLYLSAMIDGLSPIPDIPDDIRAAAAALVEDIGAHALHQKLAQRDPATAKRLDPSNKRRIARAWEVLEATGRPLSDWQDAPKEGTPDNIDFHFVTLIPERQRLYERCNLRFDQMITAGVMEEVTVLSRRIDRGELDENAPVTRALGFHHLRNVLMGDMAVDEAIELSKVQTRQYAKRQVTWFRHQRPLGVASIHLFESATPKSVNDILKSL